MPSFPDKGIIAHNVKMRMFRDNQPVGGTELMSKATIKKAATVINKRYFGKKRRSTDIVTDGYDVSCDGDLKDMQMVEALQAQQDALDNSQPVPDITIMFTFTQRNGRERVFAFTGIVGVEGIEVGEGNTVVTQNFEFTCEDRRIVQ